jgi:hypothetical protein
MIKIISFQERPIMAKKQSKKRFYDVIKSKEEGSMMSSNVGQANMPQDVIMKMYPNDGYYLSEDIEDGLSAVDAQKKSDVAETKKNLSKSKY